MSDESKSKRIERIKAEYENCLKTVSDLHVKFSDGNRKTGLIPSVSLIPIVDCANCKACAKSCYDFKNDMIYPTAIHARCVNSAILKTDRVRYFKEISNFIAANYPRAFRWHIGGDIKDTDYFDNMCKIAREFHDVKFLAFTKLFTVINEYVNDGNEVPENLHVLFSGWRGQKMPNPHNFPTAHPIFQDGTSAPDGTMLCTGNCSECLKENRLCWNLKPGEAVGFIAH